MYISKIVNYENMQRCLSIGRRATKPALVTAGVLLSTYELLKQSLMQSGRLEESLAKVTSSKIGIHEGTVNSRSELLKRLKRYRMLFGIINTSRESQILARLEHAIEDMETDVSTGALRKQPFCVVLYGNPGVGKSSFSIQLAKKLMHGRYGRFTSHDMVTLNETDEYQSEFRTSHKVVLFDDIGAAKLDRPDTANPWRKVIDFVNNVQKTALNPNCEMKGKVYIQPHLVILTTNLDLSKTFAMVGGFMNCPEPIERRCSSVIHLLDYHTGVVINYDGGETHRTAYCGKMPSNLKSGLETAITRESIVTQLDEQFREHMIDQQNFVDKFNSYFDDLPTIDETYDEQSEVYEPQAAIAPQYDPLHEERLTNYLFSHIDWDFYFCAYPYGHQGEVYYFDGYVYSSFGSHPEQAINLHQDYMNELRQKMLDITPDPYKDGEVMDIPGLIAEGNSVSIKAESDTCIVSDFQNDAFVESNWDYTPKLKDYDLPIVIDESCPHYQELLSFTASVLYSLKSWPDLELFLDFATEGVGARLQCLPQRYEDPDYQMPIKMKRRVLRIIAKRYSYLFKMNSVSVFHFFMLYPPFGFPPHYAEQSLRWLERIRSENLLNASDVSIGTFSCSTPPNSVSNDLKIPPSFDWTETVDSDDSVMSDDISTDTLPESTTGDSHYRELLRDKVEKSESNHSDPSTSHYKDQSEDEFCDEFIKLLNLPKGSVSQITRNLKFAPYGEIDLILEIDDFIIVGEMKRTPHQAQKAKANKQAIKYGNVVSILRPGTRVFGITYTYSGMKICYDNGLPYTSNVCDNLFLILGYTKRH